MAETKTIFGIVINTTQELRPEAYSDPEFIAQNYDPAVEVWENMSIEESREHSKKVLGYKNTWLEESMKQFMDEIRSRM